MILFTTIMLLTISLTAVGQNFLVKKEKYRGEPVDTRMPKLKPLTYYPGTFIHMEYRYTDPNGIDVIVQNSLPRGQ